jgi:hypothetical protein
MHELERIKVIEAVCEHRLTMVRAAERLGLCERQISRLVRRYAASGPAGLISGKRGQPSNRELPVDLRARAMALVRERYADFGPTLACEKLRECHNIELGAYSTPNRTLIPRQTEHGFHSKASADSTANRAGIPRLPEREFHA